MKEVDDDMKMKFNLEEVFFLKIMQSFVFFLWLLSIRPPINAHAASIYLVTSRVFSIKKSYGLS